MLSFLHNNIKVGKPQYYCNCTDQLRDNKANKPVKQSYEHTYIAHKSDSPYLENWVAINKNCPVLLIILQLLEKRNI